MKVTTVLVSLFLSWVVPPTKLRHELYSRDFSIFFGVEGLNVAKISPWPRSRIGTASRPEAIIQRTQPSLPGHCHNLIRKTPPTSTVLKTIATERQEGRRNLTRLCTKNTDDDEGSNTNSSGTSDDISNEKSQIDKVVGTNKATTTMNRLQNNPLSDFLYGANYVHSRYLSILWRYSILRSFAVTLPIGIVLWMNQEYGLYDSLFRVLRSVLAISSVTARLLQLPLEFAQSLLLNIWNVSPEALAAAIDFLPNAAAIPLVQLSLSVRATVTSVVEAGCGNNAITFLSSTVAILVWRPAVEEWQYRSVLDKLLFGVPRWILVQGRELSSSTIAIIQRFASIGANLTGTIVIANNEKLSSSESSPSSIQVLGDLSLSNQSMIIDENNGNSTNIAVVQTNEEEEKSVYAPSLPGESARILLGSLLFATTRLGWLSSDPTDSIGLSNSPYGFTIGFLQSIWSLVSSGGGTSEVQHGLRIFILLLAIHQTVGSFLVAQHVFAGIYRRKGLAASVGAHVSWTVGKGTIFFRLLWRFWQSTSANVWRAKYGSSPEVAAGGDDDPNPSRGDGEDE